MASELIPIPHQGCKPAWLEPSAYLRVEGGRRPNTISADFASWSLDLRYFLDPTHWAAPVLRAGLTPWNPKLQGDGPPKNYAGGKWMTRDGELWFGAEPMDWEWLENDCDIIGYEPAPAPTVASEAVETNPEVMKVDELPNDDDIEMAATYLATQGWGWSKAESADRLRLAMSGDYPFVHPLPLLFMRHRLSARPAPSGVDEVVRAHLMPGDPHDLCNTALQWYLSFAFGYPHTVRESNIAVEGFKDGYRAALASYRGGEAG